MRKFGSSHSEINVDIMKLSCFEHFKELAFRIGDLHAGLKKEETGIINVGSVTISPGSSPLKFENLPSAVIDLRPIINPQT